MLRDLMNTGVQRSGATPPAARTATTQAVGREPGNRFGQGDGSYEIDYDYCKGCGLCAAECPCGAVEMEPEPS